MWPSDAFARSRLGGLQEIVRYVTAKKKSMHLKYILSVKGFYQLCIHYTLKGNCRTF